MFKLFRRFLVGFALILMAFGAVPAYALTIYAINSGAAFDGEGVSAINDLNNLGHTVSTGGTLGDYSTFDQVWDLRFNANLGASDITAMGSYLSGGGRMYLSGENSGFDATRNNSLVNFIGAVGGGSLSLAGGSFRGTQNITAAGQVVNSPNAFGSISYAAAQVAAVNTGNSFLVSESAPDLGSLVAWSLGDIAGSPSAKMLVGFDIEIFRNGQNWTENMATYLAATSPVPIPAALPLFGTGLGTMGFIGWRRKRRAAS